jgi:glycosyltransferase involved in cell wall biosynthesis
MRQATVLIPTHNHGPTLRYAIESVRQQTVKDIEIFVIGDGVPEITREIIAELSQKEPRLRFFDHPKGPRNGEAYRHAALASARGKIVCYLSDDDLWLPAHIETMQSALTHADFAHALPVRIMPGGALHSPIGNLALPHYRHFILSGINFIPLSCAAHTLDMYPRLPHGWRTTPQGIWTDMYMWQQFLELPQCRALSSAHPTVLHFPSSERRAWTLDERLAELAQWSQKYTDRDWQHAFLQQVVELTVRERAEFYAHLDNLNHQVQINHQLQQDIERLTSERDSFEQQKNLTQEEMTRMRETASWRLRQRFLQLPFGRSVLQKIVRLLAGERSQ